GSPFHYPSLNNPGCPPPIDTLLTASGKPHRLGGSSVTTCYFRSATIPLFLSNVAVPFAEALDAVVNGPGAGTNSNGLTQLFLGGRTQVQAMMDAHPTFVSVWIGNNDLLAAAEAGDTTLVTDTASFRASYAKVVDSIEATGATALLVAVGLGHQDSTVLPLFSRGSTWYGLAASGARSEEHTSELQSRFDLVCRLLLEKKKELHRSYGMHLGLVLRIRHMVILRLMAIVEDGSIRWLPATIIGFLVDYSLSVHPMNDSPL